MTIVIVLVVVFVVAILLFKSVHLIGPTQVGLVNKRFAVRKLPEDNPIAFRGEAGYQAELLTPGLRMRVWPVFAVQKFPWVQVPAGEIGVVIAQVGQPLPIGAKSGVYRSEFANFSNLATFVNGGGQKGVQRPVLPPGTLVPIHPVAFLVLTPGQVYGVPVSPDIAAQTRGSGGMLSPASFGLAAEALRVVVISPEGPIDMIGIVTVLEGEPLPSGDIASRLKGYADVTGMEKEAIERGASTSETDALIIEVLLGNKNIEHNNYQDIQAFLEAGGKIGLQHDPLLYGAYLLNPFLVRVEMVPMLVVNQGEVAVIKAFVGLPTLDTSGTEFKFGSIVSPGHRGIWREPLRTGKYPINPRCYAPEIVPTSILTLNWSQEVSASHNLDAHLAPIEGKSREGFVFSIELQVQIHVPDTRAPKVISMVGTMLNLVNEVLQSAVGNHFRNTLQDQAAVTFIETRMQVQQAALVHVTEYLQLYEVETKGVYIQNVHFPEELVKVLTEREIANQEKATFEEMQRAQTSRIEMEKAKGTANMQAELANAQVSVEIQRNRADARQAEATGEAAYVELTGRAEATKIEAIGLAEAKATEALGVARATGFEAQKEALGGTATALVAVANAVADGHITVVPEVLVIGGGGGGSLDGLAATLIRYLGQNTASAGPTVAIDPVESLREELVGGAGDGEDRPMSDGGGVRP
ncbi:MAG: SPFH domain-containing protein [Acidimicrobiia bacterium]